MKNRIQKWGNSLGVRIPKSFAESLGWAGNTPVRMSLEDGALVIKTDTARVWDLETLLAAVTDENIHAGREDDPGSREGRRGR
jgi:antitoxin MazE